jgi:hypothetical protein
MGERDIEEEERLEKLRDQRSRRRAREQSDTLSLVERAATLVERAAFLAMTVVGTSQVLLNYPDTPSVPAVGYALCGGAGLLYRGRR